MLTADELPGDNADLASVEVDFPRLSPDSPDASPVPTSELLAYLSDEVPDGDALSQGDVPFVRTARVGDAQYWVWRFREPGQPL